MFDNIVIQNELGAAVAEFISLGSERIVGWPTEAGFLYKQQNADTKRYIPPGNRYTSASFLAALARLAATDIGDGLHLTAASTRATVPLTRTMTATELAELTGYDQGTVRQVLYDYLTFPGA